MENGLSKLAGSLIQPDLPLVVLEKINEISRAMAQLLGSKGYDSNFLLNTSLKPGASSINVGAQFHLIEEAVDMLRRLYNATSGR